MEKHSTSRTSPLTIDAHIDTPWLMTKYGKQHLPYHSQLSHELMKKGSLGAAFFALYLSDKMQDEIGPDRSKELIQKQIKWISELAGCKHIETTAGAYNVQARGFTPIFMGLEGGRLIYSELEQLRRYRAQGVRYLTITHNRNTSWAHSATDADQHLGLTHFGFKVIDELNKLGIVPDISHSNDITAEQILLFSGMPVIATHSGCRKLVNLPRNIPDYLIKKVAENHGVVCIPFAKRFIGRDYTKVADHIDHVVQLVGIEHVGIGSDLDGAVMADGITDVSDWSKVVKEPLVKRGYKQEDIDAVAGGNIARIFK